MAERTPKYVLVVAVVQVPEFDPDVDYADLPELWEKGNGAIEAHVRDLLEDEHRGITEWKCVADVNVIDINPELPTYTMTIVADKLRDRYKNG